MFKVGLGISLTVIFEVLRMCVTFNNVHHTFSVGHVWYSSRDLRVSRRADELVDTRIRSNGL